MLEDPYQDEEEARDTLLPKLFWAAVIGLALAAALYPALSRADEFRSQDRSVALVRHDAKCDDADILAHILRLGGGDLLQQFKKATLTYGGRDWRSCWIEVDGMVYSIDEEGSPLQPLPARLFRGASI